MPQCHDAELMFKYQLTATEIGVFPRIIITPMSDAIIVGLLMDRYGPRRLLTLACVLCASGTFLFASGISLEFENLDDF